MFSVATGAAESMKSITYSGKVDGLIVEIEILAWDILGLDPPRALKKKRKKASAELADGEGGSKLLLYGLIGLVVAGGGAAVAMGGGGDAGGGGVASSAIGEPPSLPIP
jgi:hypothetical protein